MSKVLNVYLHADLAGLLKQDKHGRLSFQYSSEWLEQTHAVPLSHSLPLREKSFVAKECQGFFAGILPEEENRKIISSILGISSQNDFALLEQIGGECAGAISFLPPQAHFPEEQQRYQILEDSELEEILTELPARPLMAGYKDIRLSLAGAQNKLAVHLNDHKISLPLQHSPSTHIIKPSIDRFPGLVQNEVFCMSLAKSCGLNVAEVDEQNLGRINYFITKRYDRIYHGDHIERIHQEDFCQALGLPPHLKYENEGGPTLAQCFELVRNISTTPAPDILTLLDAVTFNFIIGNNDAHGKNFSFLYFKNEKLLTARLAPLYDLISTAYYTDLSPKMAMRIGKKYIPKEVRIEHWESMWNQAGFAPAQALKRTTQFAQRVLKQITSLKPHDSVQEKIASFVDMRATAILRMK